MGGEGSTVSKADLLKMIKEQRLSVGFSKWKDTGDLDSRNVGIDIK